MIILNLCLLIYGIVFVVLGILSIYRRKDAVKITATIINSYWQDGVKYKNYIAKIKYLYNKISYENEISRLFFNSNKKGTFVKIYINPNKPETIYTFGYVGGFFQLLYGIAAIITACWIFV